MEYSILTKIEMLSMTVSDISTNMFYITQVASMVLAYLYFRKKRTRKAGIVLLGAVCLGYGALNELFFPLDLRYVEGWLRWFVMSKIYFMTAGLIFLVPGLYAIVLTDYRKVRNIK